MAVANGNVFVCDFNNHRIAIFSTNGTWSKNFGSHQSGEQDTHGIAVDANGNIFISYHQANVIYKFSPDLTFIKSFGSAGSGDGQFNGVLEMAIGPNNRLYVVDHAGHRVQYFDLDGNFLGKFGSSGAGNGNFNWPWGIAVSKDNKVYVADRDNHRIQVFDANGNFLSKFGTQGSFDGQFQQPHGLAIATNGILAVADNLNRRIQLFTVEGNYAGKFAAAPWGSRLVRPARIIFSHDGILYSADNLHSSSGSYRESRLRCYDLTGAMIKEWGASWAALAETQTGNLIAAHGDRVVRVWNRTFRTVHPDPSNALPLPTIVSQKRRPGTSLVDVDYTVKDADNTTVQTAALAFKNGGNSLADVIPITSFAEGTANKLGSNIATGQTHKFTWDVARDWSTDFGEVQLEILAKDGRGFLNLDFIQIPAGGDQPALKISRSPLNDNDFLSVWYWLIATGDSGFKLENGAVVQVGENLKSPGLFGEYFASSNFTGQLVDSKVDETFSFNNWSGYYNHFSTRWTGEFVPTKSGQYTFKFGVDDVVNIWVNGQKVVSDNNPNPSFTVSATANTPVPIRIDYDDRGGGHRAFWLNIVPPGESERAVVGSDFQCNFAPRLASGTTTTASGRAYIFAKMGLREATAAEVTRAKEAGTPGVINQWEPKFKVGPDERPAKINAYGFDTGADGYWAVPIEGN
jgi:hypothetical protein